MGDAKKNQMKIAKARDAYRRHLVEMQAAGLLLGVTDPNNLTAFDMSGEAEFVGAVWKANRVSALVVVGDDGVETRLDAARSRSDPVAPAVHPDLGAAVPMYQISSLEIEFEDGEEALQKLALVFRLGSAPQVNLLFQVDVILPKEQTRAGLLSFSTPLASNELNTHLNENQLYYSQQIWLSFDPGLLTIHLAPYTIDGKRLIEYIDPTPISAAGNSIVFRWKDEDADHWTQWKTDNVDPANVEVDIVALPTGGVFAEAVLGRFNSAEKLDITRFWNWQDSPIPITAPDIAALQAGQQDTVDQPQPGSIEAPVVTIQNPQPLPDPTSTGSIMSALTAGNLFRDMSGAATTGALAQAALAAAAQGAQSAAGQAGANMATAGQFQLEMTKLLAAAALGIPAAPAPGLKNVSTAGAAINKGAAMDAAAGQAPNPLPLDGSGAPQGPTTVPGPDGTIVASLDGSRAGAAFDALIGKTGPAALNAPATGAPATTSTPRPNTVDGEIQRFLGNSGSSAFTLGPDSAARKEFADRLKVLADHPRKLQQDGLMACGMAAFIHVWLKTDKLRAVRFAIDLYEHGRGHIGGPANETALPIVVNEGLLNQDYPRLVAETPPDEKILPSADWLMLSAVRNGTPPVEGGNNQFTGATWTSSLQQKLAGIVFPHELQGWLRATGQYFDVLNKASVVGQQDPQVAESLLPQAGLREVIMLMDRNMLNFGPSTSDCNQVIKTFLDELRPLGVPNHYVVLDSEITPDAFGNLKFSFWCWGDLLKDKGCPLPYTVHHQTFAENFYGALIAVR